MPISQTMRNLRSILVFHPALWGLALLQIPVIAAWIALDPRISFNPADGGQTVLAVGVCLLIAVLVGWRFPANNRPAIAERTRVLALGLVFLVVTFTCIRLLNYLSMSLALPLADDFLDSWDRLFGLDWHAFASGLSQYPAILPYTELPYTFTIASVVVIFVGLTFMGRIERAREFVTLLFLGALVTVCVSGFFPAEGPMLRYGNAHLTSIFGPTAGVYYVESLRMVREAKELVLSFAELPGLASFPSFHTIVALLIVYACRGNIFTLLLVGVWSGAMLLATPVFGGHYFIDVVGGFLVTVMLVAAYGAFRPASLRLVGISEATS